MVNEDIKKQILEGVFENYISLGMNCYIAKDLEKLNLRNCSSPFDWTWTRWSCIEKALNGDLDFLHYRDLYQSKEVAGTYFNKKYDISMPHDFNQYEPLIFQLKDVRKKYKRRISRFNENIKKPTLFFRIVIKAEEVDYLYEHYDEIINLIKSHNELNEIIFLVPDRYTEFKFAPANSVTIHMPEDLNVCRDPLTNNKELYELLSNAKLSTKESNSAFEVNKNNNPVKKKFIVRFFKKYFKNFTYRHIRRG